MLVDVDIVRLEDAVTLIKQVMEDLPIDSVHDMYRLLNNSTILLQDVIEQLAEYLTTKDMAVLTQSAIDQVL